MKLTLIYSKVVCQEFVCTIQPPDFVTKKTRQSGVVYDSLTPISWFLIYCTRKRTMSKTCWSTQGGLWYFFSRCVVAMNVAKSPLMDKVEGVCLKYDRGFDTSYLHEDVSKQKYDSTLVPVDFCVVRISRPAYVTRPFLILNHEARKQRPLRPNSTAYLAGNLDPVCPMQVLNTYRAIGVKVSGSRTLSTAVEKIAVEHESRSTSLDKHDPPTKS